MEMESKISRKRLKAEATAEEVGEDRISALPDCLLHDILSRLPSTKDSIRTGTLSERWEHIWTWVPTLSFTSKYYDPFYECPQNPNARSDFCSLVDKTLTQCCQLKLKKFEVGSSYDIRFELRVNNWIRFAISRDVEELNLRFWNRESIAEVTLHQFFFVCSCFTDLRLSGCILNPIGAISWKNLRNLYISRGSLDDELIRNILTGSPLLETLELNCGGYRRLDIASKSMKKLVLSGYIDYSPLSGDSVIKINAPNISSLTIQDELVLRNVMLLNVSSLVEAKLDYTSIGRWGITRNEDAEEIVKGLILSLRHVKELKIGGSCYQVVCRLKAKGFEFPSNIKFPVAIDNLVESGDW